MPSLRVVLVLDRFGLASKTVKLRCVSPTVKYRVKADRLYPRFARHFNDEEELKPFSRTHGLQRSAPFHSIRLCVILYGVELRQKLAL